MRRAAVFLTIAACAVCRCLHAGEMTYTISGAREFRVVDFNGVTRAEIPDGVTKISSGCFWACETLEEVVFPESLEEILGSAFWGCTNLKSVEIPDEVRLIYSFAFRECRKLESVRLPELLANIEEGTFMGCVSLREIELPVGLTNIEKHAFADCKSLCRVFVRSDVYFPMSPLSFTGCPSCREIIRYDDEITKLPWVEVPLDPTGGTLADCRLRTIRGHNYGILPEPQRKGYAFEGWWTDAEGGQEVFSTSKVKNDSTLYAHWRQLVTGDFDSGGAAKWSKDSDGIWRNEPIAPGESTWLRTTVEGSGKLAFEWRLSYRHPTHYTIDFLVDNDKTDTICFEEHWLSVTNVIDSPGLHTLEWLFSKAQVAGNECYALVRNISWTPHREGGALPYISAGSDDDAIAETVEGANFADTNVAAIIGGNAARYADFRAWASGVAGGAQAVVESRYAAAAYLLGAQELFEDEPRIVISDCEAAAETSGGGLAISASFLDGDAPHDVTAEKVTGLLEMTSDLRDWEGEAKLDFGVVCDSPGLDSAHSFRIIPSDPPANSVFLRIHPIGTTGTH